MADGGKPVGRPRPEHFGLTGRSVPLDPRVNAFRRDIADIALAGRVVGAHYAEPMERVCVAAVAALRAAPGDDAELISELLHGELFEILDCEGGWAWGFCAHDHYVGYIALDDLGRGRPGGWRVVVPSLDGLPMGAWLGEPNGHAHDEAALLAPGAVVNDPVAPAERLLGTPYRMGGRSFRGIDCSGLVQVTLGLAGKPAPRDSDMQADGLGARLAPGAPLERGDLVFFPGHVGMMVDGERMIHATGFHRAVVIEPLAAVARRILGDDRSAMSARRP